MPDQGLAPWVSANDKPSTGVGAKPVTGDAAERRLKGEVMQLPSRDRRRIKDLVQNDVSDVVTRFPWHTGGLTAVSAVRSLRVYGADVLRPPPSRKNYHEVPGSPSQRRWWYKQNYE